MNVLPTQPRHAVLKNTIGRALLIGFILCLNFTLQAQDSFAKIEKNVNILAKDFIHELNVTKDTLVLQSDKKIQALYSIHEDDPSSELNLRINKDSYRLPLQDLNKGRHLFVAIQSHKHIVFVIEVLQDFIQPDQLKMVVTDENPERDF